MMTDCPVIPMQRTPILVKERVSSFNQVFDFVAEMEGTSENGKLAPPAVLLKCYSFLL